MKILIRTNSSQIKKGNKMINESLEWEVKEQLDLARIDNVILLNNPCNRGCVFCFNKQNGPIGKKEYLQQEKISKNDFKEILKVLDYNKNIALACGDIFDYPSIYNIIEMVSNEMNKRNSDSYLEINSTFADFDIDKINIFKKMKNVRLNLSLITFDTNFKNSIMAAGWSEKQTDIVKKIIKSGILCSCVIWTFGDLNALKMDLGIFKETIKNTNQRNDFGLTLSYPASTRFSNRINKTLSKKALSNWDDAIKIFIEFVKYNSINWSLYSINDLSKHSKEDISYQKRCMEDFKKRVNEAISYITSEKQFDINEIAFITSKSCYNYAKEIFPNLNFIKAKNIYFGEDISCCSLLTYSDIEKAIKENKEYFIYVLNKNMITKDPIFDSIESLKKEIGSVILQF